MKLTQEEAEKYLKEIADGKKTLSGIEAVIFEKLRAAEKKTQALQQRAQQAQQVLAQAREELSATSGEARGYVDLLLEAEAGRRDATTNSPAKEEPTAARQSDAPQ